MTSLPPPPTADDNAASCSATITTSNDSNNNNDYGPVTRLAAIAAIQEEEARIKKRRAAQASLQAHATLVGETALAIAAVTTNSAAGGTGVGVGSASAHRSLTPLSVGTPGSSPVRSSQSQHSQQKMSVAARARAAADLPRPPPRHNNNNKNNRRSSGNANNNIAAPPSSGNAGVSRGKFSKAQVKQMIDEWGREDTSEDDDDYYDDGTSDSSVGDNNGVVMDEEHQYKHTLGGHHHLQYTMSNSPGRQSGEGGASSSLGESPSRGSMVDDDNEFHYQHHKVSAYSSYDQRGGGSPQNASTQSRDEGDSDSSGGIFASAKNWLQSQRERLHQMELERQVEDQRRKLVEEGRKRRALEADRRRRNTHGGNNAADHNVVFAADNHGSGGESSNYHHRQSDGITFGCEVAPHGVVVDPEQQEDLCNIPEQGVIVSGMPSLCGFGGVYANQLDDSTDYSGVARVDSQGNILEMIPSGSCDGSDELGEGGERMKVCMKVSSPKCTLSGQGMSVNVDMPDVPPPDNDDYGDHEYANNSTTSDEDEDDQYFVSDIKIVPEAPQDEVSGSARILQTSQMKALIGSGGLPPSLNFCKWKRLYNLTRDGDSFEQFLRLVEGHDRTVLVVKTTRGQLFGGYADTRWEARHVRQHAFEFYGSAQACLFRFPNYGMGKREDKTIIYKWSGANRYIQLCDAAKRTVAFGGGGDEGDFGLCIEDDFRRGTTGHCSTFENEALCEEGYFDVMDLEVWGFTLDF
ncbi:hypothetical protein ACHAXR_010305 [Thalassiosira sp. AJA248-18]